MERLERIAYHRNFRIVTTAAKEDFRPHESSWDVLVSVSKVGGLGSGEPVMLNPGKRHWGDPVEGITEAMAFAKQRIDANDPVLERG